MCYLILESIFALPSDDASIEKSMYSFHRVLLFANTFERNQDDLLFSSKSQMKRKTKLAICS